MRRVALLAVALFFLLAAALAYSQQPSPSPEPSVAISRPPDQKPESGNRNTDTDQRGSEQAPFIVKVIPAEQTEKEPQPNGAQRPTYPTNRWSLSDKIAVIASIAGMLQFLALVATIWVMIRNGRRQLRAYVFPDSASILDGTMLDPPQPERTNVPGIVMTIRNSGQTPAYQAVSWAQIAVINVNDETNLTAPEMRDLFSSPLGSGAVFNKALWFDRPLAANEITDISEGTRAIYLYGKIAYRDAFKKARFTNFRFRYIGRFPPHKEAIINFSERGNDAN
jgi:hypothetical protein